MGIAEEVWATSWLREQMHEFPVSSGRPSAAMPFQRWYRFKEAFSPEFVASILRSMDRPARNCIDPFGGSGTTALTAQFLGVHPVTIEVNPFLSDLIRSKLQRYDVSSLINDFITVLNRADKIKIDLPNVTSEAPPTLCKPGLRGRWIFDDQILKRLLSYRYAIESLANKENRTLLKIMLGSTLIPMSNVTVSGKGRRYRANWSAINRTPDEVDALFVSNVHMGIEDISRFGQRMLNEFTLVCGDSREVISTVGPVDVAIFSPPYPNSFDYTDIYNIELWVLGYLNSRNQNHELRKATLRSHVQIDRPYESGVLDSRTLKDAIRSLKKKRKNLWNSHIPEMIMSYFHDIRQILEELQNILRKRGNIYMVIGNSRYAGVTVHSAKIISELARTCRFKCVSCNAIREMRSSAQQGGKPELSEFLLVLETLDGPR